MKGVPIRSPWIDMILDREKTWEIRGKTSKYRGEIALIQSGSGTVVGVCDLVAVHGPLTEREYAKNSHKHGNNEPYGLPYGNTYAWELANVRRLKKSVPYVHPSGAVTWVNLSEEVEKKVKAMLGEKIAGRKNTAVPSQTVIEKQTPTKRVETKENPKKKWKRAVTYRRRTRP